MKRRKAFDRYSGLKFGIAAVASVVLSVSGLGVINKVLALLFVWIFFLFLVIGRAQENDSMVVELSGRDMDAVIAFVRQGKKLDAIKMIRQRNPNISLEMVSEYIDSIEPRISPPAMDEP